MIQEFLLDPCCVLVLVQGLSDGSDGKESARNAGDLGSISGLGRSLGGGHGSSLLYCLEKCHLTSHTFCQYHETWKIAHIWLCCGTLCKGDLQRGHVRVKPSPRFSSQGCFHLVTLSPSEGFVATEFFMYSDNTLTSALPGFQALPSSPTPTPSPGSQRQGVRSAVTAADSPIINVGETMSWECSLKKRVFGFYF